MAAKKARSTSKKAPAKKAPTKPRASSKKPPASRKPAAKSRKGPGGSRITGLKKAEGDAPVRAYFAKIPAEHRAIGERIDAIVAKEVPEARRAIKWSSPMWGLEGRGWFMAFGSFKQYAKVNFFKGSSLDPVPPEGEGKDMRSVNIPSVSDLDEKQMRSWVKQAAAIPGWGK